MTYQERLEQLLLDCVQKSEKYLATRSVGTEPSMSVNEEDPDYREWELAETAYMDFLDLIKMNQINPGDVMTG